MGDDVTQSVDVARLATDESELVQWNERLNRESPMALLERNSNPLIRFVVNTRNNIVYSLGDWQDKVVGDIGCEYGTLSKRICGRVRSLHCIDIDARFLTQLQRDMGAPPNVHFTKNNVENLKDIPTDTFDITVAGCVLPHVPSPDRALRELVRVTKPGGQLIIDSTHDTFNMKVKTWIRRCHLSRLFPQISMGLAPGHLHEASRPFHLQLFRQVEEVHVQRQFLDPFRTFLFFVCTVKKDLQV